MNTNRNISLIKSLGLFNKRDFLISIYLTSLSKYAFPTQLNDMNFSYQIFQKNIEDIVFELPQVPLTNSHECNIVLAYTSLRNDTNIAQIREENRDFLKHFLKIVSISEINNIDEILNIYKLNQEASRIILNYKNKFKRIRPSFACPDIYTIVPVPIHYSYPSGHATQAYLTALYLSEKYPEFSEKLFRYAYQVSINREIAGLHYPSDTSAGYILAKNLHQELKRKF